MKLILLPGLDGTGKLFSPLLQALSDFDCEVISLPEEGDQDYQSLTAWVREKLPDQDFLLIAESFSGPIAAALSMEGIINLKGVIFVATFLSSPDKHLINMARFLPLKFLSSLPLTSALHRALFLGKDADQQLVRLFQTTVSALPSALIKARLTSLLSLPLKLNVTDLPAAYIQAADDRLVSSRKYNEFEKYFKNITLKIVKGPHFIMQAKPIESSIVISELCCLLAKV